MTNTLAVSRLELSLSAMDYIADHIIAELRKGGKASYSVVHRMEEPPQVTNGVAKFRPTGALTITIELTPSSAT